MSYEYEALKAEQRAAALLRRKGWSVNEPLCPDCHGMGFVWSSSAWGDARFGGGSIGTMRCPRGCPIVTLILGSMTERPIESNWPLCTCPKGNYVGDWICARHNPPSTTTGGSFQ